MTTEAEPLFGNDPAHRNRERLFDDGFEAASARRDEHAQQTSDMEHAAAILKELDDADTEVATLAADAGAATDPAERDRLLEQAETLRAMNVGLREFWRDVSAGKRSADGERIVHRSGAAESHSGDGVSGPGVRPSSREPQDMNSLLRRRGL